MANQSTGRTLQMLWTLCYKTTKRDLRSLTGNELQVIEAIVKVLVAMEDRFIVPFEL